MSSDDRVDSKTTMFCLAIFMITGMGLVQMQPVLGGALVDKWGLSLQQMGVLFGVELVFMALACAVAAYRAHAYDRRLVMQIALVVTLLANVGSMLADGFVMLCIARLAVGVSGGVIQAIVYATTTLRSNKDRTFAVLNIAILVWGAVSLGGLPPLLAAFGTSAVFAGFVALSVASLAIAGRMPQRAPALLRPTLGERAAPIGRHGALLLVLFVLLFAGHGVLWVYQERIGKAIGISPEHIGLILGLSVLSGAVGAALAGVVGAGAVRRVRNGARIQQWIGQEG